MTKLKIKSLAVHGSPKELVESAGRRIEKLIAPENYLFTDSDHEVLFFLTGGTELSAMKLVSPGHYYLLVGSQHDNSYASATEVKAHLNEMKIPSLLLDEEEAVTSTILNDYLTVKKAMTNLKGKKLGLIGKVSDWLISSEISSDIVEKKLGIELTLIPWSELPHFSEFKSSASFLETFSGVKNIDLTETAKVSEFLMHIIESKNLDAVTVECFPMVKKDGVTACLPLAKFNNDGIPAGCEGDLTAIAGMMLCKELTGTIPWIANINKVSNEACIFSHCTIAPGLVSEFSVKTHFETGVGTAIQGKFKNDQITIFRFDKHLSKAFIATANITGRPKSDTACRTQIEVKLTEDEVKLLKHAPLGNHHLIFPGDCKKILQFAFAYLGIDVQK
jgi:L-fucose isomerase-like protein